MSKLCECGCGRAAPIAQRTNHAFGHIKGQPVRFILGHNGAKSPVKYVEEARGFTTPCWVWQRTHDLGGYGQLTVKRRTIKAATWMWEQKNGPVPNGLHLDHLCRVRACVNPDHLEPVTPRENLLRGVGVSAINAAKTHCKHGHPFDEENTRIEKDGRRKCRACDRRRWHERKKRGERV